MTNSAVWKQNPTMITRTIDGLAVIMDPREGKVIALNPVGTLVWELADGSHTQDDILRVICGEYDISREAASSDLDEFAETLLGKGLLLAEG